MLSSVSIGRSCTCQLLHAQNTRDVVPIPIHCALSLHSGPEFLHFPVVDAFGADDAAKNPVPLWLPNSNVWF